MDLTSPIGRFVQGAFEPQTKDKKGNPLTIKTGPNAGQATQRYIFNVAFEKMVKDPATGQMVANPEFAQFYGGIIAVAKQGYPQLFPANSDVPTHPRFATKVMDGDGVDGDGNPNKDKPGFAGCWIVKFSSQFPPSCFHVGKYDPMQQIQNPKDIIKRGYYVRVGCSVEPNIGSETPGVYMNHKVIELVGYGPEIIGGPDAGSFFAQQQSSYVPAGMTTAPVAPQTAAGAPTPAAPGATPSAAPSAAPAAAPAAPSAAPAAPAPAAPAAPAPAAPATTGPQYTMTAKAQGATWDGFLGNGWKPEDIVAQGYAIQNW
jgi:hypothetical protein